MLKESVTHVSLLWGVLILCGQYSFLVNSPEIRHSYFYIKKPPHSVDLLHGFNYSLFLSLYIG